MNAKQLKNARESAGLTQLSLANKSGLSLASISNYERGYPISEEAAKKIRRVLPSIGGNYASEHSRANAN